MEQIAQILPMVVTESQVNKMELMNLQNNLGLNLQSTTLTQLDNEILKVKYSSKFFSSHTENEQEILVINLMMHISFITGWVMPTGEMMKIAQEELIKKINEDYPNLNINEIKFAFRSYGTQVEDWGKAFNLNLFDKVLPNYLEDRIVASDIELRIKSKPPVQTILSKDELDNEARQRAVDFYTRIKRGKISDIPTDVANILMQDFEVDYSNLVEFVVNRVNSGVNFYEKK